MRAALYHGFDQSITVAEVERPEAPPAGAIIKVAATGLCRSDWHGWKGHDPDIRVFPHVPGHEFAGVVESVGHEVTRWRPGARVTVPFVAGCGHCSQCLSGNHQVCDHQSQPGFTHWGSFAEYVRVDYADVNLVELPPQVSFVTAASLGCRFITAYRAVVQQGRVAAGTWLSVWGCGGVGLSCVMIAKALGARVLAVDVSQEALAAAELLGADLCLPAQSSSHPDGTSSLVGRVREMTGGGPDVSIDALGSSETAGAAIESLRKRGRHVQVGLMTGPAARAAIPWGRVVADELEVVGSHGMAAHTMPALLSLIETGRLDPQRLVARTVSLEEGAQALMKLGQAQSGGMTVIRLY